MDLIDLDCVIERLREQVPALRLVGGSAELELAQRINRNHPAAYVVPSEETGVKPTHMGSISQQQVWADFAVTTAVSNVAASTSALRELRALRAAQAAALMGWVMPGLDGAEPVGWLRGRLVGIRDSTLWWADEYRCVYVTRYPASPTR